MRDSDIGFIVPTHAYCAAHATRAGAGLASGACEGRRRSDALDDRRGEQRPSSADPALAPMSVKTTIRLDWRAYFAKFCEEHGEPVNYRGRLLFRDGYMYSATNHAGPEYSPPAGEELLRLQRDYWSLRRKMIQEQIDDLTYVAESVFQMQAGRSVKLQQTNVYKDDEGKVKIEVGDVDRVAMLERMRWLVAEAKECDVRLQESVERAT
jgi:hypothetical protein